MSWSSAIRLGELVKLRIGDVLERTSSRKWRVREVFNIGKRAAKEFVMPDGHKSYATGKIHIDRSTREALRSYLYAAIEQEKLALPIDPKHILFFTYNGPISKRLVQKKWHELQIRLDILDDDEKPLYKWHDTRHAALSTVAREGNAFDVMAHGRFRCFQNVIRYVTPSDERIIELVERGHRRLRSKR
jgi:hypothetical protein